MRPFSKGALRASLCVLGHVCIAGVSGRFRSEMAGEVVLVTGYSLARLIVRRVLTQWSSYNLNRQEKHYATVN